MSERFYDWSEAGHRQSLIPNKTVVEYERLFSFSDITEAEGLRIIQQKVWNFFCDNIKKYGFSEREGQQDMALDIAEAIAEKKHLIVEAGVGIGKSFAYIVPLLFFHQQYKRPIVISTSTITLQEQLVDDIGRISEILNSPIQIIVAKGQTHYVCRRKVEELPNSKERGALLAAIEKNASERTHFPFAMPDSVWESICISNYGMKVCGKCTFYKDCCFTRLRREMKSTNQAIVCNHDLLTAHLKKEKRFYPGGLLPSECPVIVIDEAHNLEDKVRSSLTHEYTKASIEGSALAASDAAVKEGMDRQQ